MGDCAEAFVWKKASGGLPRGITFMTGMEDDLRNGLFISEGSATTVDESCTGRRTSEGKAVCPIRAWVPHKPFLVRDNTVRRAMACCE